MNDQYCYQTSKKIRQVFDYKRRNGQYIGAFAPYGYVKHPKDKHQLIIDPDAAEIVKLIFSLFLKGTSKRAIALYLNEHGVPSPSAYKLLVKLTECHIVSSITLLDEQYQCQASVLVVWQRAFLVVDADS